jgi:hypothetical protein
MLTKPVYALSIFIIARPIIDSIAFFRVKRIYGDINYLQAIGIALPLVLLVVSLIRGINLFKNVYLVIGFSFTLLCLPSVFLSKPVYSGIDNWMKIFTLWVIIAFTFAVITSDKSKKLIFKSIVIASVYPMIKFLTSILSGNTISVAGIDRIVGGYHHMGPASFVLLLFVPAYLYFIETSKNSLMKFYFYLIVAYLIVCIYFTYYRSSLLGVVFLVFAFMILRKNYKIAIACIFVFLLTVFSSNFLSSRFAPLLEVAANLPVLIDPDDNSLDNLMSGRFGIWRHIFTLYLYNCSFENLLFGFGYGGASQYQFEPHNDYLNIFFRNGFLALLLFMIFLLGIVSNAAINKRDLLKEKTTTSILIASLLIANSTNYFFTVRVGLYIGAYIGILLKDIDHCQSISRYKKMV